MTIQLTVTIAAHYTDWDDCPPDKVHSAETVIVQIPQLEAKFVVFPKLLDGLTGRAIERLRNEADKHLHSKANPTLFDEPLWPGQAILERDDVLIEHCMHLLDEATYDRCYVANLIIGVADVLDPSIDEGDPAAVYTWYRIDDSNPEAIEYGEHFTNFYEAAATAVRYLDSLEGEPEADDNDQAGDDLSAEHEPEDEPDDPDWRAPNFVTDAIKELAGHGYEMQVRKHAGDWQYRWRHELPDRVDTSPPFAGMEDAIADACRYLEEPEAA